MYWMEYTPETKTATDTLTLIPYYAWNHRGATRMNIWFPQGLRMMEE